MRLLNVNTLRLSSFDENNTPAYAIASHRWGPNEATFEDVRRGRNTDSAGYRKVVEFCTVARTCTPGYQWLWIDTCCIDKRSSSELSESINSMFRWYANAGVCFAYLADVEPLSAGIDTLYKNFKSSVWFKRGWTLQELLAPDAVVFLTQLWEPFGSKGTNLLDLLHLDWCIADITSIPPSVLSSYEDSSLCSDDQKWKWIDGRETYRQEDMAYCLLGIFGVNMSLRYGEGVQAKERLREEIRDKKRRARKKRRAVEMAKTLLCPLPLRTPIARLELRRVIKVNGQTTITDPRKYRLTI